MRGDDNAKYEALEGKAETQMVANNSGLSKILFVVLMHTLQKRETWKVHFTSSV